MKLIGYTLPAEISLLERQGVANIYDKLRSNEAVALYTKPETIKPEKVMELAAESKIVIVVNGKYDVSMVPPAFIQHFAELIQREING